MKNQSTGWRLPNSIIIILSILSIAIGVAGLQFMQVSRFITALIQPPIELSESTLTNTTQDMLPLFKAKAHGDEMFNTEAYEETTTTRKGIATSTKTTAYFGLLAFGEHVLMVKTRDPISESLVDYEGMLTSISVDKAAFDVYNGYIAEASELKDVLVPMLLDATSGPTEWAVVYLLLVVLVILGLAGFVTVWRRRQPQGSLR